MKTFEQIVLITSLLYHIILLIIINKKNKKVTFSSSIIFAIIFYFDIIPFLIYSGIGTESDIFIKNIVNSTQSQFILAEICIFIFSTVFALVVSLNYNSIDNSIYIPRKGTQIISLLAYFSLIVGGISFLLYMSAFGGIIEMINNASYVRSFSFNTVDYISYPFSLFVVPSRMLLVTPILFYSLKRIKKSIGVKIAFIVSIIFASLFLLFNSGKTQIIMFIIPLFLPIISKYCKKPWRILIIVGCLSFPLLGVIDSLFYYFGYGTWKPVETSLNYYISSFAYPFSNIINLNSILEISGYHFFDIFLTSIINLAPGIDFDPSYVYTSQFYGGTNWKSKFGVPIDIITMGYIQINVLGVLIIALFAGLLCNSLNKRIKIINNYIYEPIIYSVIALMFPLVVDSDLGALLKGNFTLLFGLICIFASCKKRIFVDKNVGGKSYEGVVRNSLPIRSKYIGYQE